MSNGRPYAPVLQTCTAGSCHRMVVLLRLTFQLFTLSYVCVMHLQDMGGAALMLALCHVIFNARLPVRLRVLLPAVENAVSGSSYRPGDVLQTRAGITVGAAAAGGVVKQHVCFESW